MALGASPISARSGEVARTTMVRHAFARADRGQDFRRADLASRTTMDGS
jgi:hypothetical protein